MHGVLGGGSDAPGDRDAVLEQLTEIDEEWSRANTGDREAVERILADEYVGTSARRHDRAQADTSAPQPSAEIVSPQEFEDLRVVVAGGARS